MKKILFIIIANLMFLSAFSQYNIRYINIDDSLEIRDRATQIQVFQFDAINGITFPDNTTQLTAGGGLDSIYDANLKAYVTDTIAKYDSAFASGENFDVQLNNNRYLGTANNAITDWKFGYDNGYNAWFWGNGNTWEDYLYWVPGAGGSFDIENIHPTNASANYALSLTEGVAYLKAYDIDGHGGLIDIRPNLISLQSATAGGLATLSLDEDGAKLANALGYTNLTDESLITKGYADSVYSNDSVFQTLVATESVSASVVNADTNFTNLILFETNKDILIGSTSVIPNITNNSNIGIGSGALYSNISGDGLIGIGLNALQSNTGGYGNIAIGEYSQRLNISSYENTSIGRNTLFDNLTGNENTALGAYSMRNTLSRNNTGIGAYSLFTNTTGQYNTVIGNHSMYYNLTGTQNASLGANSLENNTTGSGLIGIGYMAGSRSTTLSNRLFINSISKSNILEDTTQSIIYGKMHSDATKQELYLNANTHTNILYADSIAFTDNPTKFLTGIDTSGNIVANTLIIGNDTITSGSKEMSMYIYNASITIPVAQNVYSVITGWEEGYNQSNYFTVLNDSIQLVAGDYSIEYNLSFSGSSTDINIVKIYDDGVDISTGGGLKRGMSGTDSGVVFASWKGTIPSTSYISFRITNTVNSNDPTISFGNISIRKIN